MPITHLGGCDLLNIIKSNGRVTLSFSSEAEFQAFMEHTILNNHDKETLAKLCKAANIREVIESDEPAAAAEIQEVVPPVDFVYVVSDDTNVLSVHTFFESAEDVKRAKIQEYTKSPLAKYARPLQVRISSAPYIKEV